MFYQCFQKQNLTKSDGENIHANTYTDFCLYSSLTEKSLIHLIIYMYYSIITWMMNSNHF